MRADGWKKGLLWAGGNYGTRWHTVLSYQIDFMLQKWLRFPEGAALNLAELPAQRREKKCVNMCDKEVINVKDTEEPYRWPACVWESPTDCGSEESTVSALGLIKHLAASGSDERERDEARRNPAADHKNIEKYFLNVFFYDLSFLSSRLDSVYSTTLVYSCF